MLFSDKLDFVNVTDDHPRAFRAKLGKPDKQKAIDNNIPIFVPINLLSIKKLEIVIFLMTLKICLAIMFEHT